MLLTETRPLANGERSDARILKIVGLLLNLVRKIYLYESSFVVNVSLGAKIVWSFKLICVCMNHRELRQNVRTSGNAITLM